MSIELSSYVQLIQQIKEEIGIWVHHSSVRGIPTTSKTYTLMPPFSFTSLISIGEDVRKISHGELRIQI